MNIKKYILLAAITISCVIVCFGFSHKKRLPEDLSKIPFGSIFTPHMFVMEWDEKQGWHNPRIEPYAKLSLDPACMALHYGQEIFEGMKAFAQNDGSIAIFRPHDHLNRMNVSAKRMCMPEIDVELVLFWMKKLIAKDEEWVPQRDGTSVYIRPTMIASESTLYLKPASHFTFFIILSPVGSLHANGFNPIPIWVSDSFTRSSIGGVGAVKTGGNYAASMLAQQKAKQEGCAQVLWLDPVERAFVEEVGSMNIFFVIDGQLVTPSLTGTILAGITRKSVIELAKSLQMPVIERRISIDEIIQGIKDGSVTEIFGTGTAASVTPIGQIKFKDVLYTIGENKTGQFTNSFFNALQDIQYGKSSDSKWMDHI